jgi:LPS export ABC transporter protein LptC
MNRYYSSKFFQIITMVIISSMCILLDALTKIHFSHSILPTNEPEYTATGADGSVFAKNGKLLYRLTSDKAWQYPHDKKIYLKNVHVYFYNKTTDALDYQITGDDGWVNTETKTGMFGKNVIVIMSATSNEAETRFYGSMVNMDLDKNLFYSNENIKVVNQKSNVTAHGFSYTSDNQFLTLNSKVRVFYDK